MVGPDTVGVEGRHVSRICSESLSLAQAFTPGEEGVDDASRFSFCPLKGTKTKTRKGFYDLAFPGVNAWARENLLT